MTSMQRRRPVPGRRRDRDRTGRVLAWGSLPPPVHGSSIVNVVVAAVIDRAGDLHWVNAATMRDLSEMGRVNGRKVLASIGRVADYALHALSWAPAYTAYVSIALVPPALYRDLVIWTVSVVTSRRTVIHVHTGDLSGLRPAGVLSPLQRWLMRRSEFWVLGSALAAQLRAFGATDVHVVANGVTCESPHHGEGRGADEDDLRVVFLSHHFLSKGVDVVAELVEVLEDEPFAWTLAGSAVEPETEAMLRPLERLGSRYRRIEAVDTDVRCRLLHESDVLVLPSRWPHEASPLVLIEAMEHGVIPIVSSHGCMPEVVGGTGAVCDSREEYAEALRLLARDRAELRRSSDQVLATWLQRYSRASFEDRVAALLLGGAGEGRNGERAPA